MASTTITLTIPEGQVERIEKALCTWANLPVSGPNAKLALREWVTQLVERQAKQEYKPESVVIE